MPLSWNEIKSRATAFSKEWENEVNEDAEAKSFWDSFFNVFGISRRRVATFEQQVRKIDNKQGYIDLLWKGMILVEHKSRGKDLDRAYRQAKDYFPGLTDKELPRYILVSDFERFRLYDLENGSQAEFKINEFVKHVSLFSEIAGYRKKTYKEQDPVNIDAAELMGKLHDRLKEIGYTGHNLEVYLVRLVFCLFADDTNIFERGIFNEYIDLRTEPDGSDLAAHLAQLFDVLNSPRANRLRNLDENLDAFPYVNGKLFEERLPTAAFDSKMRNILLECCSLDWGRISPAIFGSLFQSVMDEKARRNLGAHYTSEKNILKLIKPLFLDELWKEFEFAKDNRNKLLKFHEKISSLRFLDPACGCGNFLIVAYRELRLLEIELVKKLLKGQQLTDIGHYFLVDVDQFYGIEYEEFPAQIAQVAMWLIDHQMNMLASEIFGEYYVRLPLRKSATIKHGNALQIDWQSLIEPMPWEKEQPRYHYIIGNPPFIGYLFQNDEQKKDLEIIFSDIPNSGVLDYVTAWYIKASQYMQFANAEVENILPQTVTSFVSTNSISQGEQVGLLWGELFNKYHIKIHFAHRTFNWTNEARGKAAVHVVIVGFSNFDIENKRIFEYDDIRGEPHEAFVKNINPYLVGGNDSFVVSRNKPICVSPSMSKGSQPTDDGNLIFNNKEELESFLLLEPKAKKFIRKYVGSREFINSIDRWCLWMVDADPSEIRSMKGIVERIERVKVFRSRSTSKATQKYQFHHLFQQIHQPEDTYLVIPSVSSERRPYIPFGFFDPSIITSNLCLIIPNGSLYHFGVLSSLIHMTWVKYVCGRLKSDYRYSKDIVYNNYPWPENPTNKQKEAVEKAAQGVLDARAKFPDSSLADLYDPNTMPPGLVKAHQILDKAVDLCYRPQPFPSETKRIEFLFELYDKYTTGLFSKPQKKKKSK